MGKGADEMNDNEKKSQEIEDSIHRTEAQMADTITTIQHRLSPQHLKDEAVSRIRETASKGMEKFQGAVKSNPAPFVAAAAGLAFLLMRRRKKNGETSDEPGMIEKMKEKVRGTASRAASSGEDAGEPGMRPPEMAVGEETGPTTMLPMTSATQRTGRLATMGQERPLLLGAVGLAVGAVLGALLPVSRRERELLAQAREALVRRAREAGRSTMQRVQDVASGGSGRQAREQTEPTIK